MKTGRITRREFLIGAASVLGGVVIYQTSKAQAGRLPRGFVPLAYHGDTALEPTPTLPPVVTGDGAVVHIRDANATNWTDASSKFFNHVNQNAVSSMVREGLEQLTGRKDWPSIWDALFHRVRGGGYASGQKIAIKVNFNTSRGGVNNCDGHDNQIDGLPEPVIGLLEGLKAAGVAMSDVIIYEASVGPGRVLPAYFRDPIRQRFSGVQFIGRAECAGVSAPTYGSDPSLILHLSPLFPTLSDRKLVDVLHQATYLINVPLLKAHSGSNMMPFTAAFKNHFGSIHVVDNSNQQSGDTIHDYIYLVDHGPYYREDRNPMVEIYKNRNISGKTVLTLGDGLFGCTGYEQAQRAWNVFGGKAANSLYFSTDPVAMDCVLGDTLRAEWGGMPAAAYGYLFLADEAGLGVMEGTRANPGSDPFNGHYQRIHYQRVDL